MRLNLFVIVKPSTPVENTIAKSVSQLDPPKAAKSNKVSLLKF